MVAWAGTLPVSLAMALGMLLVLPESARELLARDAPRTEALAALRFLQPQLFDEPGGVIDEARDWNLVEKCLSRRRWIELTDKRSVETEVDTPHHTTSDRSPS